MQIIDLRENDIYGILDMSRKMLNEKYFCNITTLHASSFSFITSTRLANQLKKSKAEIVIVDRLRDAIAAVSARKLVSKQSAGFKIIYSVSALATMPHGVPTEVCRGIDCWVFDNECAEKAYSEHEFIEVHRSVIIPPTTSITIAAEKKEHDRDSLHISVVGNLDDGDRMQRIVRAVASCSRNNLELHVYGTGKPRTIMPIVNEARHLDGLKVVWHGSNYDLAQIVADSDLAVGAYRVPGNEDIFLRSLGVAVVEPEKIAETIASSDAIKTAGTNSLNEYNEKYSAELHVQQWHELFNNII
jgi:hypothetical protein